MKTNLLDGLFDKTISGLEKSLDLRLRRNQALTSNVANAETPGYRAVDLNFATELERAFGEKDTSAVKKGSTKHLDTLSTSGSHLIPDQAGATRSDGNNVDIDLQMGKLAFNAGQYSTDAMLMRRKFMFLKNAIREGGR